MFSIGQAVQAIDDDISGLIIAINEHTITIETEDGFEMNFKANNLIASKNQLDLMKSTRMMYARKTADTPQQANKNKPIKTKKNEFVFEVDLHIEKLIPSTKNLSNYDILNIQIDTAKQQLEFAIRKKFPKIIFIHGVGEGVLKADLNTLLGRYDAIRFQDANYHTYGIGATEVTINQR